jgi:hypothetical protein
MITIHSFFPNDISSIRANTLSASKQAELSNKFLKKHQYTTILYTDAESISYFKHIPYDDIRILDLKDYQLPNTFDFWSVTKLVSCLSVNEPFYHVDLDLFLVEDIIQQYKNEPFIALHYEPWIKDCFFSKLPKDKIDEWFNIDNDIAQCYNFGIFGGMDHTTIKNSIEHLITGVNTHNNEITEFLSTLETDGYNWKTSVFLEQYILPSIIAKKLNVQNLPVLVPESITAKGEIGIRHRLKKHKILHLWGLKNTFEEFMGLNLFLDMIDKYYF